MTVTDLQVDAAFTLDLIEKLKAIKTANGYLTNIGLNVDHNIAEPLPETDAAYEGINVVDDDAEEISTSDNAENYKMHIKINTICVHVDEPWLYVKKMNRDVRKCLGLNYVELRETYYLKSLKIVSHGVMNIEEAPKTIGEGSVTISIQYKVNQFGINERTYSVEVAE